MTIIFCVCIYLFCAFLSWQFLHAWIVAGGGKDANLSPDDGSAGILAALWPIWIIPWILYRAAIWVAGNSP